MAEALPLPRPSCIAALQGPSDPNSIPAAVERVLGSQLLAWRRAMLRIPGSAPAVASSLDWLLDLAGGVSWTQLQQIWLHPDRPVVLRRPLDALETLWRRHRHTDAPLQYLVGRCPWRDLELSVAPGVLIPRQETELLVDLALALAPSPPPGQSLLWADLGTGSGAIALCLARAWPDSVGLAVDVSAEALRQAAHNLSPVLLDASGGLGPAGNAPSCSAGVQLKRGHWWQAIEAWWGRLQLVVSNPPYIPTSTLPDLDPVVRDHEPTMALDGGSDGLEAIRTIIAGARRALAPGGVLLLEHHHDQSAAVLELLQAAGASRRQAHSDLEGVLRFASARWGEERQR